MKKLEEMTMGEVLNRLINSEHHLLRAYNHHRNLIPYLSRRRVMYKLEYERRLYGH